VPASALDLETLETLARAMKKALPTDVLAEVVVYIRAAIIRAQQAGP
jgi:hypothetical protein